MLRDEDVAVSREGLDAVREFMTDGIDSPLFGSDPLAARRGAEELRHELAGAGSRSARPPVPQPETAEPPLPLP